MNKARGLHIDPGLCRLCGRMKRCRLITAEYEFCAQKEVYSDMLLDCFGLSLSHLDGKQKERLVCATCVTRLREACSFKKQVLLCEEAFIQMKIYDIEDHNMNRSRNAQTFDLEAIKSELDNKTDSMGHCEELVTENTRLFDIEVIKSELDDKSEGDSDHCERLVTDLREGSVDSMSDDIPVSRLKLNSKHSKRKIEKAKVKCVRSKKACLVPKNDSLNEVSMEKLQQSIRLQDPSYIRETNRTSIIEYSYVCPFKCNHNHLLCYYCGFLYIEPDLLRRHTIQAHSPSTFRPLNQRSLKVDITRIDCRLCDAKIDNLDDFKQHITKAHNKEYYFECEDGLLPFRLVSGDVKCVLCEEVFPYFHALNKHMNKHFSNYVCETCGLGFVDRNRLLMHQQRHFMGDVPCHICGKIFKGHHNRELHIDRVHNKRGRIYCPKCDMRLLTYPQKLKHLVEVHGEEPLRFPCGECGKVFNKRRLLTTHIRKDHLKDYRYACEVCGQRFFTNHTLKNHMPTHTQERNFKCKVCEKCYPREKTLKDHMRIHANDRRYKCHVCGQGFIQNCSLKGHIKSQHPEYSS